MKIIIDLLVPVFLGLFISNLAIAEGEKLRDKLSKGTITITADIKDCDDDAKKYCPGLDPHSQNAFMCMMAYEQKLSDQCKVGIAEAAMAIQMGAAAIDYSVRACEADADTYCLNVKPGEGRLINCLKKNESKVSEQCVTALKQTGLWDLSGK